MKTAMESMKKMCKFLEEAISHVIKIIPLAPRISCSSVVERLTDAPTDVRKGMGSTTVGRA